MSDENSPRLRPRVRQEIAAQKRRMEAYRNGDYELADDEGFTCPDCGWKGLSAPANIESQGEDDTTFVDEDAPICICPECGGSVETHETGDKYLEPFKPPLEEVVCEDDLTMADLKEAYKSGKITLDEFEERIFETVDFYEGADLPEEVSDDLEETREG